MIKIFKLIFNILITFIVVLFLSNFSFANTGNLSEENINKPKTIKQLKENIEVLKSKKVINFSIFEKFKLEHWELQNYFSKDITSEEFSEIKKILSNYKKEKELIKSSRNDELKKLLDLETEFYNSLLPYIDKEKIDSYKIFIEKSLSTIKKEDEIKSKIKDNKKEINKKVSTIKEKIEENNRIQQKKIDSLLKEKIKIKIIKFKNSEKFSKLSDKKQELIFKLILKKINTKKNNSTNLTGKKLKLYNIIEEVLLEIIWEYKKA